jgi:bacterioferritin (cytochrome b1)
VCQLIKAGGGEKKREFIHKSVAERGGIERHEAQQHTHTQKEAIHSNQIVRRCLLLLHPRPKQQQQQRNTRMKSEISPFFLFCFKTKKC